MIYLIRGSGNQWQQQEKLDTLICSLSSFDIAYYFSL